MRREKDIVGPEHGGTLRDLGVSLPPGVQAHQKDEMLYTLREIINGWKRQAYEATHLALAKHTQIEIIQNIQEQVTPLIKAHDLAHLKVSGAEGELDNLERAESGLQEIQHNPLLDQYRTEKTRASTEAKLKAARAELNQALKAVEKTDSKLPSWLRGHRPMDSGW